MVTYIFNTAAILNSSIISISWLVPPSRRHDSVFLSNLRRQIVVMLSGVVPLEWVMSEVRLCLHDHGGPLFMQSLRWFVLEKIIARWTALGFISRRLWSLNRFIIQWLHGVFRSNDHCIISAIWLLTLLYKQSVPIPEQFPLRRIVRILRRQQSKWLLAIHIVCHRWIVIARVCHPLHPSFTRILAPFIFPRDIRWAVLVDVRRHEVHFFYVQGLLLFQVRRVHSLFRYLKVKSKVRSSEKQE